jgi:pimeloyl-ACP methyl ester carboxylesterase
MAQGNITHIDFRGIALPVLTTGEGPKIGYLHGPLGNPGVPQIVSELGRSRHVIAPTLPGFFGADACEGLRTLHDWVAALAEVLDSSGLRGCPVVASSVTAMLALELAAINPAQFEHLFLVAPLGLWDEAAPVADLFACLPGKERTLLVSDPSELANIYEDEGITDSELLVQRSVYRFVARTTGASLIWPIPEFGLADRIHRVLCPVTLFWGAEDRYVPPAYGERFRSLLPNLRKLHIVQGASHLADLDRPEQIARLIGDAFNREYA